MLHHTSLEKTIPEDGGLIDEHDGCNATGTGTVQCARPDYLNQD